MFSIKKGLVPVFGIASLIIFSSFNQLAPPIKANETHENNLIAHRGGGGGGGGHHGGDHHGGGYHGGYHGGHHGYHGGDHFYGGWGDGWGGGVYIAPGGYSDPYYYDTSYPYGYPYDEYGN